MEIEKEVIRYLVEIRGMDRGVVMKTKGPFNKSDLARFLRNDPLYNPNIFMTIKPVSVVVKLTKAPPKNINVIDVRTNSIINTFGPFSKTWCETEIKNNVDINPYGPFKYNKELKKYESLDKLTLVEIVDSHSIGDEHG